MTLKCLGRGAGFADEHTSAYFTTETKEMVIIDCPVSSFQKLKHIELNNYEKFYILVTHTHGDHVGGLGLFVQYAFFVLKKPVTIVAPSKAVADDISTILTIEGNELSWYNLVTATDIADKDWFGDCILTKHSPQLEGKCFGYRLIIDDTNVVYTGDTSTLEPFMPYLIEGSTLYVDTSVYYGMIHLKLEDALDDFLALNAKGIKIYLMHLDDVAAAAKIVDNYPDIEVVETSTLYVDTSRYYGIIHLKPEEALKDDFLPLNFKVYLMHLNNADVAEEIAAKITDEYPNIKMVELV